jgi:hypothetical protein
VQKCPVTRNTRRIQNYVRGYDCEERHT